MKTFLKTVGFAILYDLAGNIIYLLLMLVFAWMAHWWWIFIILIGIGSISWLIGFNEMLVGMAFILTRNWIGKILAVLISVHLLSFSLHAVWTTDFLAENAKEITVKIMASIVFIEVYLPCFFCVFLNSKKEK
jgi:hypothetical protein